METDHLLLYADIHRAPSPVEMDANLVYLEGKIEDTAADAIRLDGQASERLVSGCEINTCLTPIACFGDVIA